MKSEDIKLTSFGMWFSVIAAILVFAGIFKLFGDTMALLFTSNGSFAGLGNFGPFLRTLLLSWLGTFGILIWLLPKFFKKAENRISIVIGTISAFTIIAVLIRFFGFDFLLGGPTFDITKDYLDIIRNLLMGGLILGILKWREGQHSTQQ